MKKAENKKQKFHKQYELYKDNHQPDYELKEVSEIYLPFWVCTQSVVAEKEVPLDRFSKIILQAIKNGLATHSEICGFLGVDEHSFVTCQFHYLIKNGLIEETTKGNKVKYEITSEGISFLEKRKKITSIETEEFKYFYNDLTQDFLDIHKFNQQTNDPEKELADMNEEPDFSHTSRTKQKKFSGYQVLQTKNLTGDGMKVEHKNRPYNLNRIEFAKFFNQQHKNKSFYDFESGEKKMHRRSICFLAFEYEDESRVKIYEIRHSKKTVKSFDRHELEELLSKKVTEYMKENN